MTNETEVVHELRIQSRPFEDLLSGAKTGEVRNSDRGFKVGDFVLLNEVAGAFPVPTGRQMRREITHVQTGYDLPEGICVLSYAPAEDARAVGEEPVRLTAVATLRDDGDGGLEADWLVEGGTSELFEGMILLVADNDPSLCEEDGSAELYRSSQRPVVLPERRNDPDKAETILQWHKDIEWNACLNAVEALNK